VKKFITEGWCRMKIRARVIAAVVLLLSMVLLTGCFFNIFQTARTVGAGNVALTLGVAVMNLAGEGDYYRVITPQGKTGDRHRHHQGWRKLHQAGRLCQGTGGATSYR